MKARSPSKSSLDKATVIIPCYNVGAYISECLDSVKLQGESVHHTYVVDNNSTDDTVNIARDWKLANPDFPLTLLSEKKSGAPAARNLPIAGVETTWIQFLDADDLLMSDKIMDQMTSFPDADVICAASEYRGTDDSRHSTFPEANIPLALFKGRAGNTCANLFKTAAIKRVGGWDESLRSSQESDLMFRLWQSGATFNLDMQIKTQIRERHHGQITQRNPAEKWLQFVELRVNMLSVFGVNQTLGAAELSEAYQVFYSQLLILANHDLDAAKDIFFKTLHPLGFQPKGTGMKGLLNGLLFRTMGFGANIKLKQLISRYRSMLTNQGCIT